MSKLRIALAQINPTVGDLNGNVLKIKSFIKKAQDFDSDIVVFPELSITGYPPEDLLLKSHFIDDNISAALEVSKQTSNIIAIYGFVEKENDQIYNSAVISSNNQFLGTQKKIYLPNYGVFDEKRYFSSGNSTLAPGPDVSNSIIAPFFSTFSSVCSGIVSSYVNIYARCF